MLLKNISGKKIVFAGLFGTAFFAVSALLQTLLQELASAATVGLLAMLLVVLTFIVMNDQRRALAQKLEEQARTQYQLNEALFAIFSSIKPRLPLPPLDGWAMSPHSVVTLISIILRHKPKQILELGSGSSTIISSYLFEQMGQGNILSLDHDDKYSQITADNLNQHGLSSFASIVHTPIVEIQKGDRKWQWYDFTSVPQLEIIKGKVDLLVIDGPPTSLQNLSRLPAFFLLKDYLSQGAMIILDDYDRPGEVETAQIAVKQYGFEIVSKAVGDNAVVLQKM